MQNTEELIIVYGSKQKLQYLLNILLGAILEEQ